MFKKSSLRRQEGATAVEYGLIVGLIAAVIIFTLTTMGGKLDTLFKNTSDALPTATR